MGSNITSDTRNNIDDSISGGTPETAAPQATFPVRRLKCRLSFRKLGMKISCDN